ncbi:MAG: hydroxyacid dehydrogenase [Bacteroidetes bacterium]|jgi:D-3-phosphoglycerate dehydrogenase|nr:hydroxyacid dehydrogenase [Bacteroidota bacterium]MDF2452843.1 hydroxyacid dehydrogenase [Bacteroidota bacterium]
MKKILCIDSNHDVLHEMLMQSGFECDLFWNKTKEELVQLIPSYDGIVIRSKFKITKDILDSAPKLKVIGRVGAGMENIDVEYANSKGIVCVSAPEGNRDAVGEQALGMLLMLLNNLKRADQEVRNGIWKRAENRGHEISGKTIGIIGYGNMGSAFAKKLMGFDCTILVHDKYKTNLSNNYLTESTLERIFLEADIVSIHLPLNAETNYYINDEFISSFKKNIYIINTARGKCLNTSDLVKHMRSGKVIGACLDVLEYESVSFENLDTSTLPEPMQYLLKSEQVILTPHIAGWTHESNYKMSKVIAEKMIQTLNQNV